MPPWSYFLTNLVYTVDPAQIKKLSIPAQALITDQVYSYLYENPQIDFSKYESLDVDAFRKNIRDAVTARVGEELVHEVLIDQINFMSKEDIRDNAIQRRRPADKSEAPKAEAESATASTVDVNVKQPIGSPPESPTGLNVRQGNSTIF